MKTILAISAMILGLGFLFSTAHVAATILNNVQTEQRVVELGGAKSVRLNLHSTSGAISVRGGADKLLEAQFTYSLPEWKPELDYRVKDGRGELSIREPSVDYSFKDKAVNEWNLCLNDSVPLDVNVRQTSGSSKLDLSRLCVSNVDLRESSGSIWLDLSGAHPRLVTVQAEATSGKITANLTGKYDSVSNIRASCSSGLIDFDLSGEWANDASVDLKCTSGKIRVKLPVDTGVRVVTRSTSGKVRSNGLATHDGALVNEAFGNSKATLNLNVEISSGVIDLELVK